MATITVHRKKSFLGGGSYYFVYFDGQKIDKVKNGETRSFDISPGNHSFQIKSDIFSLSRSPLINLSVKENEVISYMAKFSLLLKIQYIIFGSAMLGYIIAISCFKVVHHLAWFLPVLLLYFVLAIVFKDKAIEIEETGRT
ncbi:MAG: hypothetical protein V1775_08340 [Bacteroidota bacterium]